jgi:hypothetical protein
VVNASKTCTAITGFGGTERSSTASHGAVQPCFQRRQPLACSGQRRFAGLVTPSGAIRRWLKVENRAKPD